MASILLSACGSVFGASGWPGLLYDEQENSLYIAYNEHVYALQAENGVEMWRYPAEADGGLSFYAAPVLASNGGLIAGSYNNQLVSIDPSSNGTQKWQFTEAEHRYIGSIAASETRIFAPNADNSIYALSDSGQLLWSFETGEAIWSTPVSKDDNVFVASMDKNLYSLRASNGNKNWERDLGGTVVADLEIDENGIIYVGTFSQEILAIDSDNGRIVWSSPTQGWIWGGPTVFNQVLYVGDEEGNLYAFDTSNGRELWRIAAEGAITGSPLVTNEHVYIGTENGQILSVGLDGRIQWTKTFEAQAYGSPILAGDLVVVGFVDGDNIAIAFDFNGNQVWSFAPQN